MGQYVMVQPGKPMTRGINIDEHSLAAGYIPALCGTPQHAASRRCFEEVAEAGW
jgi:hypothetical protein